MVGIVGVFQVEEIHSGVNLTHAKTGGNHWLQMHAVHGDVTACKGNLAGVATQGEIGGVGHVGIAVFLGIYVGVAGDTQLESDGVGDQALEFQTQGVSAKGGAFPVQVGNGGVDGDPLTFLYQYAVLAIETQGTSIVHETGGVQACQHAGVTLTDRTHAHGVRVQFGPTQDRGSQHPVGLLARNIVSALHDFGQGQYPAARIGFAGGGVNSVGGLVDGVLGGGKSVA